MYILPLHSVQARTVAEVQSEKANVESNRMWLLHKDGYSAVNMVNLMQHNRSNLAVQTSLVRHQGRETKRVKLENREVIVEVAEEDLEKVCVCVCVCVCMCVCVCVHVCACLWCYICTVHI